MRILLKCPTRSRPEKVMQTLQKYIELANHPEQLAVCISADSDDTSMTRNLVREELQRLLRRASQINIFFGDNKSKIQAANADIEKVTYPWDIIVLVSDDMIPIARGYDDVIRNHMISRFPDTNGILWFNDGTQADKLNTLTIMGRTMYNSFGYLYQPDYKSLFCDTEFTDLCKSTLKDKCLYVPYTIIRHEHPGTGYGGMDSLYQHNQRFWIPDMMTYINRKTYAYDWSIMIATIPGREASLHRLLQSIHEKNARICSQIRIEVKLFYDNRETSIGAKRQSLLQGSLGKYVSFVDDDDEVTDAYFEDAKCTIEGNYHVCRLRGQISQYTFTHSVENTLSGNMARGEEFLRPPNHLNIILGDIAKLISFTDATRGEDLDWSIRLAKTGYLSREYQSDPIRIHYIYNMGDRRIDSGTLENQLTTSYETMLKAVWTPSGAAFVGDTKRESTGLRLGPKGFVSK